MALVNPSPPRSRKRSTAGKRGWENRVRHLLQVMDTDLDGGWLPGDNVIAGDESLVIHCAQKRYVNPVFEGGELVGAFVTPLGRAVARWGSCDVL
jgi:hypothetical protein